MDTEIREIGLQVKEQSQTPELEEPRTLMRIVSLKIIGGGEELGKIFMTLMYENTKHDSKTHVNCKKIKYVNNKKFNFLKKLRE